jgi:hypothetical protein
MAGYGNIEDYKDGPVPGTTSFVFKDGTEKVFGGPQAEEYKRKLDQAKAIGPQPTAGTNPHGTNQPRSVTDVPAPVPGAGPTGPVRMGTTVVEDPRDAQGRTVEEASAAAQTQTIDARAATRAAAPRYVQSLSGKGGSVIEFREGADPNNPQPGDVRVVTRGSPGSPGGTFERSSSVRGGFEPSEEYLAGKTQVAQQRLDQLNELGQLHADNAAAEKQLLDEERARLANAQAEEAKRLAVIDNQVKQQEAVRAAAVKEYTDNKNYDPMKRALSGGKNWIYGLSAGLGAFASAFTKSPNYALETVNGLIDRDIAAQEKEIQIKGDAANNALADLERRTGSRERAKLALETIQKQLAANSFARNASLEKDLEKRTALQGLALNIQDSTLDLNEQYRQNALGEITKNYQTVQATAPTPGGARLPTAEELAQFKAGAAPQLKPSETGAAGGSADKNKRLSAINASLAAIENYKVMSKKAGTVVNTGTGASEESQGLGSAAGAMGPMIARAIEGDAATKDSMDRVIGGLTASGEDKRAATIAAYEKQLLTQKAAIESE